MIGTPTYAERLSDYVCSLSYADLPLSVARQARYCLLDALAVAIAGTDTSWAKATISAFSPAGPAEAVIYLQARRTRAADAAFINSVFAHSLDYNDDLAGVQAGAFVGPTALAVAEAVGASGQDVIVAMVAGYDVAARVSEAARAQNLYLKGFQPTALIGPFAAAAVAGRLFGLTASQLANSFGIASSFAGGLIEFLKHGTDTKRLHVGKVAHGGVVAALLAKHGATGPTTVFEGENGFLRVYAGQDARPDELTAELGTRFDILDTSVKLYAGCDGNGAPIEAALAIIDEQHLDARDIERIHARVKTFLIPYVAEYGGDRERKYRPQTLLDAQMSLPYCLAAAIVSGGNLFLDEFTPSAIRRPEVLALAERVTVAPDSDLDKTPFKPMSMPSIVTISTRDGRNYTHRQDYQTGDPRNPLSEQQWLGKFMRCVEWAGGQTSWASELKEVVLGTESSPNVPVLAELLAGFKPVRRA